MSPASPGLPFHSSVQPVSTASALPHGPSVTVTVFADSCRRFHRVSFSPGHNYRCLLSKWPVELRARRKYHLRRRRERQELADSVQIQSVKYVPVCALGSQGLWQSLLKLWALHHRGPWGCFRGRWGNERVATPFRKIAFFFFKVLWKGQSFHMISEIVVRI